MNRLNSLLLYALTALHLGTNVASQSVLVQPHLTIDNKSVPEGTPITVLPDELEKLGLSYLKTILEDKDFERPEIVDIPIDRETFQLLLAATQAYPQIPATIPTLENLEKFLLGAEIMGIGVEFIVPILKQFAPKDLCKLYQMNWDSLFIVQALEKVFHKLLSWKYIKTLQVDQGPIYSVAITHDNKTLICGLKNGGIKFMNIATGKLLHTIPAHTDQFKEGHAGPVTAIAIAPDDTIMVSGDTNGIIKAWDLSSRTLLYTIPTTPGRRYDPISILSLAISSINKTILSSSAIKINIWDINSGILLDTLPKPLNRWFLGKPGAVRAVTLFPEGNYLVSISPKGKVQAVDILNGRVLHTMPNAEELEQESYKSLAIVDKDTIVMGNFWTRTIQKRNLLTGKLLQTLKSPGNIALFSLAVSSNGTTLAGGLANGTVQIWQHESVDDFCNRELAKGKKQGDV